MYVRFADLNRRFGIHYSRQHVRRLVAAGLFPAPVRLGQGDAGAIAWPEEDIFDYQRRILAERDQRSAGGNGDADSTA